MSFIINIFQESWHLLLEASVYVIFGLLVSGLLRVFLSPSSVAHHFGKDRVSSVFKAALLGIPIPLCSCGVLPAAAALKKQGASNGATTAFLISTPESGVDSMAITYALMDPIMTVARPAAAFTAAAAAGVTENFFSSDNDSGSMTPDLTCPVDGCCDGKSCSPEEHGKHHTFGEKIKAGLKYAFTEVWNDLAAWFLVGIILAGLITVLIPSEVIGQYFGGGLPSMLLMLAMGIPLYICATASTPIAASLILKGVSPGAALVFLLAGPATNITSLTVLPRILGKRGTAVYLAAIAIVAVFFGLALDQVYASLGLSAQAMAGQATEIMPVWTKWLAALSLLALSAKPVSRSLMARFKPGHGHGHEYCEHRETGKAEAPSCAGST
ncbi:MAG: SO_0444 family Cu/Zn efflux transporter [Thermodesulfobacteriota bacterium]|nr:SO_0444 family Cu/Zn efflux transporter [Thermodesulfobacteriota bacterium]